MRWWCCYLLSQQMWRQPPCEDKPHLRQLAIIVDHFLPSQDVPRGNHLQQAPPAPALEHIQEARSCRSDCDGGRGIMMHKPGAAAAAPSPLAEPSMAPVLAFKQAHLVSWWLSRMLAWPVTWFSASQKGTMACRGGEGAHSGWGGRAQCRRLACWPAPICSLAFRNKEPSAKVGIQSCVGRQAGLRKQPA